MILEGAWYAQVIKVGLTLLLIGTVLWKMIKKEWWWESLKKRK